MKEETKRIRPYNNAISSRWPEDNKKTGKQIKLNRMKMWEIAKSKLVVSYMQTQPFHFSFHPPRLSLLYTQGAHT